MSPVVKKKRKKITITSQQLLLVLTAVCAFLLIFTFNTNVFEGILKQAAGYVVVPFQNGIATIGGYLADRSDELAQLKDVLALNKDLQEQIDQLTIENNQLQQDRYELNNLRSLYDLDQAYSDYDKIGARVISSETDNWFSSFTINKGEEEAYRSIITSWQAAVWSDALFLLVRTTQRLFPSFPIRAASAQPSLQPQTT